MKTTQSNSPDPSSPPTDFVAQLKQLDSESQKATKSVPVMFETMCTTMKAQQSSMNEIQSVLNRSEENLKTIMKEPLPWLKGDFSSFTTSFKVIFKPSFWALISMLTIWAFVMISVFLTFQRFRHRPLEVPDHVTALQSPSKSDKLEQRQQQEIQSLLVQVNRLQDDLIGPTKGDRLDTFKKHYLHHDGQQWTVHTTDGWKILTTERGK